MSSYEKCLAEQEKDFKKYITYTSFCAGFKNGLRFFFLHFLDSLEFNLMCFMCFLGTGVCNGDSGGGLAFYDEKSDRWYLQGIVSISPRKKGTFICDSFFYSVFTKVIFFLLNK